jgi:hypothetical protein
MSKARHHMKRASGGGIGEISDKTKIMTYSGGDSNVKKEAEKRKRGGKVGKMPMMVDGKAPKHHRLDRPGRKSGGAVGADSKPMSEAHNLTCPPGIGGGASTDKSDD